MKKYRALDERVKGNVLTTLNMEKALSKQLADIEKRINNLLSAIEAGAMTDSTVNRLHELEAKQKELLTSLSIEKLKAPDDHQRKDSLLHKKIP